jgi:hypothetical protein
MCEEIHHLSDHITLFETELSSLSSSLVIPISLEEGSSTAEEHSLSALEVTLLPSLKNRDRKLVAKKMKDRQIYFLASSF